jgi:hypothetical protein
MAKVLEHRGTLYDEDLLAWAEQQVAHLRARQLDRLDVQHLIDHVKVPAWCAHGAIASAAHAKTPAHRTAVMSILFFHVPKHVQFSGLGRPAPPCVSRSACARRRVRRR